MQPLIQAGLILLALTLVMIFVGIALVSKRLVRRSNAVRYGQLAMLLAVAATYLLGHSPWAIVNLRTIDFWSVLVIVAILEYSLVWASLAYMLNKPKYQQEFGESVMVSMFFTGNGDGRSEFPSTKMMDKKPPSTRE